WQRLLSIGADVVPNWFPGTYGDEIFVTIKALLGAVFAIYGSSITLSALNSGGSSTSGMSFDADGDGRIKFWGAGIVPTSNGGISVGSPNLGVNYYYGTHTSIQSTSDERAKHDIRPLEPEAMMRLVMALDPSWYRLNVAPEDLMAGFKAQQFMEAMSAAGVPLDFAGFNGKDPDHLCLDYGQMIAPLVSVAQQQQRRIEDLERKLNALTSDGK
ncbi:MAG TPA: tail fiber domain-containing protein, partial [Candidatus Limiplasma sp.]|nr:tail fiber domain-containing protein [Candidatus Limiplasma sp.]